MVLLAVRHSLGGLVGAGSRCPLRSPDELGGTKAFRTSGEVVCKAPVTTVPSTPQSEDARSEANTCSPPLEPTAYAEGEVESLGDMVPASAAAVPFDDGLELDLGLFTGDQGRYGDEAMDLVEQWVSSGMVGGGASEAGAWPPAHGGYPDPNKAIEWRRQTEPFLRHYPCSHSGGGRKTEQLSDRLSFRIRTSEVKQEVKQEAPAEPQQPQRAPSEQPQQQQQAPQVPSCRSAAAHGAHGAGMPRHHHVVHTMGNRAKVRQMLRERITRRLQAIDERRTSQGNHVHA